MDRDAALRQIEPIYFVDYCLFSGRLRYYVALSLGNDFKGQTRPTDVHKRLYILALVREEYTAYEDVGAFLLAFLAWRRGGTKVPFRKLLEYKIGEAVIDDILISEGVKDGSDLFAALRLEEFLTSLAGNLGGVDLEKVLMKACEFFVTDCRRNQKKHGIRAYNKIKHGALVVPDARRYIPGLPSAPGTIFETVGGSEEKPYTLFAIPMSDEEMERRQSVIEFVQYNLRLLGALYIIHKYSAELKALGFDPPSQLLTHPDFQDVIAFAREVTRL